MTVAVVVKVNDGIVMASDSATTIGTPGPEPGSLLVQNIYNHGTKIFKLHKKLPLGAITWGLGSMDDSSLKVLAKDFRRDLMEGKTPLDVNSYTVQDVAERFKAFMYEDRYAKIYGQAPNKPEMGFKIAGYGANRQRGEVWNLRFGNAGCIGPVLEIPEDEPGIAVEGTPSPVRRLIMGYDPEEVEVALRKLGTPADQIATCLDCLAKCAPVLNRRFVYPAMPIQDAIDLAVFLEQTTAQSTRFSQAFDTVGGPVEVAALTKYEDFKWVRRKHYYDPALNQGG
jgi:hypothetical protein